MGCLPHRLSGRPGGGGPHQTAKPLFKLRVAELAAWAGRVVDQLGQRGKVDAAAGATVIAAQPLVLCPLFAQDVVVARELCELEHLPA
jgi:hypothetical protein